MCETARGSQVGLTDQKVNVLLPDAGSELWIGTDSGLMRWDGSTITRSAVFLPRSRAARFWLSRAIAMPASGSLPRPESHASARGEAPAKGQQRQVRRASACDFEDREGNLWFGGTEGLMQLRAAPFLSYAIVAAEGGSLYFDTSGRAWVAPSTGGLLWIRGAEHHAITDQGLDGDVIYSMSGGAGELWLGRRLGGVTQLREEDGVLRAQTYTRLTASRPGVVYAVYRSREGSVWAGTLSGELSRIEKGRITTFTSSNGLSADAVTTIRRNA